MERLLNGAIRRVELSRLMRNSIHLRRWLGGVEKRRSDVSLPVANGQIFTWPPQSGLA
jgi:hypothetical protein